MINLTPQEIIDEFELEPHIEGGYFREDFKSDFQLPTEVTKRGNRSILTTCYYLLLEKDRSIFHRLAFDEIWLFLGGGAVNFYEIDALGKFTTIVLGPDLKNGQKLKHLVKKNTWFGVLPQKNIEYSFFSAIVFPGFEFADWEKGDREFLQRLCPEQNEIISKLT